MDKLLYSTNNKLLYGKLGRPVYSDIRYSIAYSIVWNSLAVGPYYNPWNATIETHYGNAIMWLAAEATQSVDFAEDHTSGGSNSFISSSTLTDYSPHTTTGWFSMPNKQFIDVVYVNKLYTAATLMGVPYEGDFECIDAAVSITFTVRDMAGIIVAEETVDHSIDNRYPYSGGTNPTPVTVRWTPATKTLSIE